MLKYTLLIILGIIIYILYPDSMSVISWPLVNEWHGSRVCSAVTGSHALARSVSSTTPHQLEVQAPRGDFLISPTDHCSACSQHAPAGIYSKHAG